VDWRPLPALPAEIVEKLPLPGGGSTLLRVKTASGEASCEGGGREVVCSPDSARFKNALVLRIKLRKLSARD